MKILKEKPLFVAIFLCIIVLLLFSIKSYTYIPFGEPDGLDFHNLYSYSTCDDALRAKYDNNIYLAGGQDCKDAMGREFVYPPLLFYTTNWVGLFPTFEQARLAWRLFIIFGLLWCLYIWIGCLNKFLLTLPFTLLLFLQYPMLFALERGNNDIMVILMWTLGYYFHKKGRDFWLGVFSISSVLMKVYPLFAFSALCGGKLFRPLLNIGGDISRDEKGRNKTLQFFIGSIIAFLTVFFIFRRLWFSWFLRVSHFADFRMVISHLNHSIQYLFNSGLVVKVFFLTILGLILLSYIFSKKSDLKFIFACLLSVTTFYSGTSYDYNLITTYPLILLLLIDAFDNKSVKKLLFLFFLLLGVIGHKEIFIFAGTLGFKVRIYLQIISIVSISLVYLPKKRLLQILKFFKIRKEVNYEIL